MKSFTIKKIEKQYELESFNYHITGFHYPIKKNKSGSLKVKEIIIVNPEITSNLICYQFNKKYQKIVDYFFSNSDFDDDSTGTHLMLALDEVAHLRTLMINKYKYFLKKQIISCKIQKFLKDTLNTISTEITIDNLQIL